MITAVKTKQSCKSIAGHGFQNKRAPDDKDHKIKKLFSTTDMYLCIIMNKAIIHFISSPIEYPYQSKYTT